MESATLGHLSIGQKDVGQRWRSKNLDMRLGSGTSGERAPITPRLTSKTLSLARRFLLFHEPFELKRKSQGRKRKVRQPTC
jgi:hypothetical protein